MRDLLISLKNKLCQYCIEEKDETDLGQLEYLIELIDYFLIGKIALKDNLNSFIEDIIATAIMQVRFELLDYVKPFSEKISNYG